MNRIKRARGTNSVMTGVFYLIAVFFFALLISFASYVIIKGFSGATSEMFRFLRKGSIGNQLFNTIYLVFISLVFSVPLGVTAGIYLSMYAKKDFDQVSSHLHRDTFLITIYRSRFVWISGIPCIFGLGKVFLPEHFPFPYWQFRLLQRRRRMRSMDCQMIIFRQV